MKKIKLLFLSFILLIPAFSPAQETLQSFSEIMQNYYINKDKNLLDKTVEVMNLPTSDIKRLKPMLTGFYSALFAVDADVKKEFASGLDKFTNERFKDLFKELTTTSIDSIYAKTPLSPEYNDMCWSSFFSTGDLKFVDKLIANAVYDSERVDRNLFLTGGSAKWSLCSNARQHKKVKEHIEDIKDKKLRNELLKKDPAELKEEIINVIKEQRAKGLWNEK